MLDCAVLMVAGRLALACAVITSLTSTAQLEQAPEVRALWVTRTALSSPDAVARMVDAADRSGFNTLVVQVRGRGDAYYRSRHEPRARWWGGRGSIRWP